VPITVTGQVTAASGGWRIGTVTLAVADLDPIAGKDWDGDGKVEPVSLELGGLAAKGARVRLTCYLGAHPKVVDFSVVG
jgi:hypothetical protein